jgi:hypothetical protein
VGEDFSTIGGRGRTWSMAGSIRNEKVLVLVLNLES